MKIMTSGPSTSWQIDGKTMETVTDFIFLGSKITAEVFVFFCSFISLRQWRKSNYLGWGTWWRGDK